MWQLAAKALLSGALIAQYQKYADITMGTGMVVIGLAYVWLHNSSEALGRKIRKLELQEQELDRRIDIEKYNWAALTSPSNLHAELRKRGLDMTVPAPDRVVVIDQVDEWLNRGRKADVPFIQVAGAGGDTPR